MEQESLTHIIVISTVVLLVFAIAMIVLFIVFQTVKNKILSENKALKKLNEQL